jgi:hypothetical protein
MATWEYHVEPESDGRWRVRRGDRKTAAAYYTNIEAAISAARMLAHINTSGVYVHSNGSVKQTDHRGKKIAPKIHQKARMRY